MMIKTVQILKIQTKNKPSMEPHEIDANNVKPLSTKIAQAGGLDKKLGQN